MRTIPWLVLVSLAIPFSGALAQAPPSPFPTVASEPLTPLEDPEVQPAQFTIPASLQTPQSAGVRPVIDPPPAMVRIQVRVPADSPPGDDIKYLIVVRNTSTADAHRVTVRNPLPEGIAEVVKSDPPYTKPKPPGALAGASTDSKFTAGELEWSFGTLKPGESKTIELVLKPKPDAVDVKNFAYVRFEHGEAVTTKIRKPALKVTKNAPKSTVRDEPYKVSIAVENTSRVASTLR